MADKGLIFLDVQGLDGMIDALKEVMSGPGIETVARLDAVLQDAFDQTQVRTHEISGRLKLSGRSDSAIQRLGKEWKGTIKYGGVAVDGVPVDYAIYEQNRGGTHDFMAGLERFDRPFEEAILYHFKPMKGR